MAKKHRGRPKKVLNYRLLDEAIKLHHTGEECARLLEVDYSTLKRRLKEELGLNFEQYFAKRSQVGKMSLRRIQWKLAERSPAMAIWLGKQYLGQTDKVDLSQKVVYQKMGSVIKDDGEEMHFDVGDSANKEQRDD